MNSKIYLKIILFFSFYVSGLFAQISPGELTSFHAHLEGLSNCTKCHELGKQVLNSKCLDCHTEIKTLISSGRGYHTSAEVKNKDCWSCHSEHHGKNFRIINFNKDNFNHSTTGFNLTGSHQKLECEKCHQVNFINDAKLKKRKHTFLGLKTSCISCHQDYHKGSLGTDCSGCHTTEKFNDVKNFDHNKTQFKLTGAHETVDCAKCHPSELKNGKKIKKFKGLRFSNCTPCHTDFHKGAFGKDCKTCHITKSFKIINQAAFDHSKTRFPLIGKHNSVKCNDCHKGSMSNKPLFSQCTDCHKDFHKGEFVKNNNVTDCKQCHNEEGFSPSLFTIELHSKLKFTLTGAHLAIPCAACHKKESDWHFKITRFDCQDCHQNVHGKELTEKFLPGNNCLSCHNTDSWRSISFNHSGTAFELLGRHSKVECRECHYKIESEGKRKFRFVSLKSDCIECHKDIHFNQFDVDGKTDCLKCHNFNNWKPEKFDHNKTKFSLEGAHSKLQCSKCHPSVIQNGNSFIKYRLEEFKCAFCHSKKL